PQWVREAFAYLASAINEPEWQRTVRSWLTLERLLKNDPTLNNDKDVRPKAIPAWFKSGRKYSKVPPTGKAATFARTWRGWWTAMQPAWRTAELSWPMSRAIVPGETWPELRKGGKKGFVIVLMTIVWW
ncbi:hypothetical protein FA95DRAFT_1450123, partial [Auriscalpium vulgare]